VLDILDDIAQNLGNAEESSFLPAAARSLTGALVLAGKRVHVVETYRRSIPYITRHRLQRIEVYPVLILRPSARAEVRSCIPAATVRTVFLTDVGVRKQDHK
jgi:hypothetical protein